jgi:NADH-quinone oxidoreductase subunit M
MFQRVMHGPVTTNTVRSLKDMNKREVAYFVPIVIMMFWMGIYPQTFLRKMDSSVAKLLDRVHHREKIFLRESAKPIVALSEGEAAKPEEKLSVERVFDETKEIK